MVIAEPAKVPTSIVGCERVPRTCQVPMREACVEDIADIRHWRPSLAVLRPFTGFQHRFALEDAFEGLIAVERLRPQGEKDGHCTVVRHQSERAA